MLLLLFEASTLTFHFLLNSPLLLQTCSLHALGFLLLRLLFQEISRDFKFTNTQDSPGYYTEAGVHMFFASRYSVLLSALYRSGQIERMVDERTGAVVFDPETGKPFSLDVSGIGLRMAAIIGL